ncbi:MAG: DUF255 domain-containing protein [Gammaproteobacteria bacterium]|nr:DUF255 domain-containing protein [Gammaproteobacteria bacterium]MCY4275447.1 DUF255 domain-containing protein [Gammaproteobacteria bacterium]
MSIIWSGQSIQPFKICKPNPNTESRFEGIRLIVFLILVFLGFSVVQADNDEPRLVRDETVLNNISPYVAKHSDDLILWQSLTPQVLQLAQNLNRPLFISSGYLACYWCHRMAEDTFSDPRLADFINDQFVPVVMDREVHVEEDRSLQSFMQKTRNVSGWPVAVILTPDGYPIFGYTYIDPDSMRTSLREFIDHWKKSALDISKSAYADSQKRHQTQLSDTRPVAGLSSLDLLQQFLVQANAATDMTYGGFGFSAKFPFVPQMNTLVELSHLNPEPQVKKFIEITLNSMLDSAVIDPIEGGLFRYSETRTWDKPHFEQMLYNQALMSKLLLRASVVFKNDRYQKAGLEMLDHMVANFKLDNGWYASSLSAVSLDGRDGGYYLWTPGELEEVLGVDWMELVENRLSDKTYILPAPHRSATDVKMSILNHRNFRPQERDDKPVLGWNGLVLSAMAYGAALNDRFIDDAQTLVKLLLLETERDNLPVIAGDEKAQLSTLETYVMVASGLFDWWQITNDPEVFKRVVELLNQSMLKFRQQGQWVEAQSLLPEAGMSTLAVPDRQIPSASGEWYRLAMLMRSVDLELTKSLAETMQKMETMQSTKMHMEAFYHATFILARLLKDISSQT